MTREMWPGVSAGCKFRRSVTGNPTKGGGQVLQPWHAAFCRSGRTLHAAEAVRSLDCVSEVYSPSRVLKMPFGLRTIERRTPWLGGVVLARWDGSDAHAWHDVHNVADVVGILGPWPPATVSDVAVQRFAETIRAIEGKGQ
jgi:hypothetical protein